LEFESTSFAGDFVRADGAGSEKKYGVVYDQEISSVSSFISEGPWGGLGGVEFTDYRGEISEIVVFHNDEHVVAIQVQYQSSGSIFEGRKYGGHEERFSKVCF